MKWGCTPYYRDVRKILFKERELCGREELEGILQRKRALLATKEEEEKEEGWNVLYDMSVRVIVEGSFKKKQSIG